MSGEWLLLKFHLGKAIYFTEISVNDALIFNEICIRLRHLH